MDLLTVLVLNTLGYWSIVLCDQILQPPYAKTARIVVAIVVLVWIAYGGFPVLRFR